METPLVSPVTRASLILSGSTGALLKYGPVPLEGTQGSFPAWALWLDQRFWIMYVELAGTTYESGLNSHMSATSPPVATVHMMSLRSVSPYAVLLRGKGSVAASASSWLMAMVICWISVTVGPSNP